MLLVAVVACIDCARDVVVVVGILNDDDVVGTVAGVVVVVGERRLFVEEASAIETQCCLGLRL